ncbi:MAG: hypothetical protein HUU45_15460, partial [Leptospiraceae bacterium]|nr:hypothetical protein [Leptospiraceae bacterium]
MSYQPIVSCGFSLGEIDSYRNRTDLGWNSKVIELGRDDYVPSGNVK